MKIVAGMILFNSDFFLAKVLMSLYPFVDKILIAEGPVQYWVDRGCKQSRREVFELLYGMPDFDKKIEIVHGRYKQKTDQCRAWFEMVPDDTDYVLCVDSDEILSAYNMRTLIAYLEQHEPTSVGFKSNTFFGGFEHIIGGYEKEHSFKRVLKYEKGCYYREHRPPTLAIGDKDITGKDISGQELYQATGISMWHGSYVSPKGVFEKLQYYKDAVIAKDKCIPNYFYDVWLPWVMEPGKRKEIEERWQGVHEFIPSARTPAYTEPFTGDHPPNIIRFLDQLRDQFNQELKTFL